MSEEVREIVYTATNFIFIAAVLFVAMLFFDLRSEYGRVVTERTNIEKRVVETNRYKGYDSTIVSGYDVMNAITTYSGDVPVYVTGAYNYVEASVQHTGRLYTTETRISNPEWFKMSVAADPLMDSNGLQSSYRQTTSYYAILVYDSDVPDQFARLMGIDTPSGRHATATTLADKVAWLNTKYRAVRPTEAFGHQVTGILFICLDVPGAPPVSYNQVAIY